MNHKTLAILITAQAIIVTLLGQAKADQPSHLSTLPKLQPASSCLQIVQSQKALTLKHPPVSKLISVRWVRYCVLQRPHTIRQAILQAIRLSSGQGLFVIPDLETYAPIAIAGSRRPNGSLLVEFRLGGWRWEHRVKEKLFEVRFRRTGVSLTSFRRIKPPSAPEANRCKAIAVACAYSFSHDLKKVGLKLGNRFQIEPQKTNADGFHMTIDTNYPATTGDCFDIGVSYNFRVLYLNPTS